MKILQMNFLIVEDEILSAERLAAMIGRIVPDSVHLKTCDSVKAALKWLKNNAAPDLAFFDIQLADGLSFEIFDRTKVVFPVIFTTAFDEYAIQAFKVNSIDYLLKPVDENELSKALEKFNKGFFHSSFRLEYESLIRTLNLPGNTYKNRFLIKVGDHLRMIPVDEIAYFFSREKYTYIHSLKDRDYGLDFSLEQVATFINPEDFFRVNRSHIVSLKAIDDILVYSGSRLKLRLNVKIDEDIFVSREKVSEFKSWLDR